MLVANLQTGLTARYGSIKPAHEEGNMQPVAFGVHGHLNQRALILCIPNQEKDVEPFLDAVNQLSFEMMKQGIDSRGPLRLASSSSSEPVLAHALVSDTRTGASASLGATMIVIKRFL